MKLRVPSAILYLCVPVLGPLAFLILPLPAAVALWFVLSAVAGGWAWSRHHQGQKEREALALTLERVEREAAEERKKTSDHVKSVSDALSAPVVPDQGPQDRTSDIRFAESAEFAALSLKESEEFSRREVQEVLKGFSSLGTLSVSVEGRVSEVLKTLTDIHSKQSLEAIVTESESIAHELKVFFDHLEALQHRARTSLEANTVELSRVQEMAGSIEEFFENIRMISLNLSIEASRIGAAAGGKALQVLAQRLRDYSSQAQEISAQQKTVVTGAVASLAVSKEELNRGFQDLAHQIHPLEHRLDSFPKIIQANRDGVRTILESLGQLSVAVQSLLKGEIGQFQFQDLTRQEHAHLAELLTLMSQLADRPGAKETEGLTQEIRIALAREFGARMTTANERKVLLAWIERHGLPRDLIKVTGSDEEAGSVILF